jgi:ABC-type cobalamin transport system permease subunit
VNAGGGDDDDDEGAEVDVDVDWDDAETDGSSVFFWECIRRLPRALSGLMLGRGSGISDEEMAALIEEYPTSDGGVGRGEGGATTAILGCASMVGR